MAYEAIRQRSAARRDGYIELLELGSKIEKTLKNEKPVPILKTICDIVKRSDGLFAEERLEDRSENSTEVVMDAQVVKMNHELVGSVAQAMDSLAISDDEFVEAIRRTIGTSTNWDALAETAIKMSRTICYSQPLFGTFDNETLTQQKEVKERRKNTAIKNSQQTKPLAVVQQKKKKDEHEATSVNIVGNQIVQLYKENNCQPLPYYALIIDPGNFMRTIHNAFQVSFLLRDGLVVIGEDEIGYPTVRPTDRADKESDFEADSHQMVCNLSTKLCEEMIHRYHITEAMIGWHD